VAQPQGGDSGQAYGQAAQHTPKTAQRRAHMAPEQTITYTEVNGYFIPNLALPEQPEGDIGKYGRARLAYLREHKKLLHMHMLSQGTLWEHLLEI